MPTILHPFKQPLPVYPTAITLIIMTAMHKGACVLLHIIGGEHTPLYAMRRIIISGISYPDQTSYSNQTAKPSQTQHDQQPKKMSHRSLLFSSLEEKKKQHQWS